MTDREKVIKGLECAIGIRGVKDCDNCPYDYDFNCLGCDIVMWDALALLREQEPVKPQTVLHTGNREEPTIQALICGNCHKIMGGIVFNYCPWCGMEVKWND